MVILLENVILIPVLPDNGFPLLLSEIDPRVHASGGVGIQRFENPPVFLADNLLLRTVPVVHQIGVGNVILDKRLLFGGQKAQGRLLP